jgi:hypothetical protein
MASLIPTTIGYHENCVLNFLNKMLYKINNYQVTNAILKDETYYLEAPNDDFYSKSESKDGSQPTFKPFSEVMDLVNSNDKIKNKKAVLKVVALKRLRLAVSITKKEIVIPAEVEYLMKWINSSSENMYLDEQESVQILYNSAYAAEIATPETIHRVQKLISPLLYWNVKEQRFRLIIEPNLGQNRIRSTIQLNLATFLDENTPKLNVIQSSLMYHYSLENQDVVSNLPDKISVMHIKEGPDSKDNVESGSVPFIKPPGPKYSMADLKNILTVTESEYTSDYIKYLYKKLDNALEEYYRKIVILFKVTDDKLAKKDADLLLESRLNNNNEFNGNWSDFEKHQEYPPYDPRRYFNGGDGGLISGPVIIGGLCMASPFLTSMYSRSTKSTAVANLLKETNEKFSNFMNEVYGSILGGNGKDNDSLKYKFKAIIGEEPTFNNLAKFLTSGESLDDDADDIDLITAIGGPASEIQNIQNMIGNQGQGAIAGPAVSDEDRKNARDKLHAMGQRIINQNSNDNSDQAVNDILALPESVQEIYENNKTSLTNMFESADINSKQDYITRFYKGIAKFLKALNDDIRENTELVKKKLKNNALYNDIKSVKKYYDEIREGIAQQKQKQIDYLKKGLIGKATEKVVDFVTFAPKAIDYSDKAAQLHNAYTTGQIPSAITNAVGLGLAALNKKKSEANYLSASWIEFMAGLKTVLARLELAVSTIGEDYYKATLNLMIEINKIDTHTSWASLGIAGACALGSGGLSWKKASGLLTNPSTQAVASGIQRVQQALPAVGTASAAAGTVVQYSVAAAANTVASKAVQAQLFSTIMDNAGTTVGTFLAYQDVEDALNNVFQPKLNPEIRENLNNLLTNPNISDLDAAINTTKPGQITLLSDENFKKEVVGPEIVGTNLTTNMGQYPQQLDETVREVLNLQSTVRENLQGGPHPGTLLSGGVKRKKKRRTRRKRKKKRTHRKIKKRKRTRRKKK